MATLMHYGIGTLVAASVFLTAATSPRASNAKQPEKESSKPAKPLIRIEPITDIWPGRGGVSPGIPKVYRGAAYFAAHNRGDGRDIWCFDGNRTSIAIETNCPAFEYGVRVEAVFKDRLLYTLPGGDQLQLWEFDGATTRQVEGVRLPSGKNMHFTEYRDAIYFGGSDERGTELWKYDGAMPSLISDIRPGPEDSSPDFMTVYHDSLYFFADDGKHGRELWRYDGTSAELVADIDRRFHGDGRPRGSRFNHDGYEGGIVYQDKLVFGAADEARGFEPRAWDGKRVSPLADISPGAEGSWCGNFCVYQGNLYFSANQSPPKDEVGPRSQLWRYDGKQATLVADGGPNGRWKSVSVAGVWDVFLILVAEDEKHGSEPWYFDGSEIRMIADAWPGPNRSSAVFRVKLGDQAIGEGVFPGRGLEMFRLVKVTAKDDELSIAGSNELRDLAVETRALREAVEKLDKRVQQMTNTPVGAIPDRKRTAASKEVELLDAGTVSEQQYRVVCDQAGTIRQLVIRAGSKVDLNERLAVGQRGVGVLKVLEGGALANLVRADIGEQAGSFGSVVVAGAGSEWKTPMGVEVGSRGHGRLEVIDGGFFSNGARADIGNEKGSTGEVCVIGKNSRWVTDWGIEIGPAGTGILLIADGGQVRNGVRFDVAAQETGIGRVFVCGPESSWTCTGGGTVGQNGTGAITVQAGGTVTARSFDVGTRGSIGGEGTIHGSIRNAGVVRSTGALVVRGDLKQENSGTLRIEPLRTGDRRFDVRIEGTAFLNGSLDLTQFRPSSSRLAEITIVSAERIEGEFSTVRLPPTAEDQEWRVRYSPTEVFLEVPRLIDSGENRLRPTARFDH